MKWKTLKICNFILAILLAVFAVGYTFAWFADYYSLDIKLYVNSAGGYFGGGSGKSDDPYKISMPQHLYNLAWLQNSGKIDDGTYFEVTNDIDMSNYIIPPIGNDDHPFNGIFDGGGCTISNLVVSTNKNHLTNFPTESGDSYYFSSYVGLFGKTGINDTTDTLYAEIKNFILNDPVVEVASENTSYSDGTSACGLAIGYVAYKASSIGVIGGTLAVNKTGYTTYNSILGALSTDITKTSVTGGKDTSGDSSSSTTGGGTGLLVPQTIYNNLKSNSYYSTSGYGNIGAFADNTKKTGTFTFNNQLWLVSANTSTATTATDNYLGLGVFSLVSDTSKNTTYTIESCDSVSSTGYTFVNGYEYSNGTNILYDNTVAEGETSSEFDKIESAFKTKVFPEDSTSYAYKLAINKSPSGNTFEGNVFCEDNNSVSTGSSTYNVYDNTIKFNIIDSTGDKYIYILAECTESKNTNNNEENVGYLNIHKSTTTTVSDFYYKEKYSYFSSSYSESGDPKNQYTYRVEIPVSSTGSVYGFAVPISGEGFYNICQSKNSTINIYYLAVDGVQNGTTTGDKDSDGTYNSACGVSAVDFIYEGVSIVQDEDGTIEQYNFVSNDILYKPTGTRIYLSTSASTATGAVLIIAFTRSSGGTETIESATYTIRVTYYSGGTDTPSQSVAGIANIVSKDKDETNFATYYDKIVKVDESG